MARYKKWLCYALVVALGLVLVPYVWSRAISARHAVKVQRNPAVSDAALAENTIRVLCFNIAHGRGLPFDNWNGETKEQRATRLNEMAELLRSSDADVVVLNEVDFDASWSHRVNQAEYLAKRAGYGHWAEQRNLDFRVGWYTWRFGNAILSKHPIAHAEVISFPGLRSWESVLAGKKRALLATIELEPDSRLQLVAAHLSHRSEGVRVASARQLCGMAKHDDELMVVAGDLNSAPPDYPGCVTTPSGENAIAELDQSQLFTRRPATPPQPHEMTFPSDQPERTIDWILVPRPCEVLSYEAIESTLSDHRPVIAEIRLPGAHVEGNEIQPD